MIKYYETEAAYAADAKSAFESQVSFIGASNAVKFDGRNVVVGLQQACTGAIAVLDGNSALHFIAPDTYSSSSFMGNYTVVGVVAIGIDHPDFRGKIAIAHKNNASKAWSAIYSFKLTGYTLDGTDRTGKLKVNQSGAWGTYTEYTISYNASTAADLVEQLNEYFQANAPFTTQNWRADADSDGNITLSFLFTDYRQASNSGAGGWTLTANLLPDIASSSAMIRYNGQRSGAGCISSWQRAITYFAADLDNADYNPTADVTSPKRGYPICKPGYLGHSEYRKTGSTYDDHCAALRAIYGEGEAGWLKYMATFIPMRPTVYGQIGNINRVDDGLKNTYIMAGKTFTKQDGTSIVAFPAADYCAAVTYNHELLNRGKWHLPSADIMQSIMFGIKYNAVNNRNADAVNKALYAIGGTAISNGSLVWSSSRFNAYYAWFSAGTVGFMSHYGMYYTYLALPVTLLDVREANS